MMGSAVAKRTATALQPLSLDEAVRAIHVKFAAAITADNKAFHDRVAAGQMLIELRRRIEDGEAGEGVEWWPWYERKFVRSRKDAEKVMRIASAENPEQALADDNAKARERMRKLRSDGANVRSKQVVLEMFSPCGQPISYRNVDGTYRDGAMPDEVRAHYAATGTIEPVPLSPRKMLGLVKQIKPTPMPVEPSNTGCNYDPVDQRGEDESAANQLPASMRVRGFLHRAAESAQMARDDDMMDLAITKDMAAAAADATLGWSEMAFFLHSQLEKARNSKKQASTLPQDGRSEGAVDDPTPEKK